MTKSDHVQDIPQLTDVVLLDAVGGGKNGGQL